MNKRETVQALMDSIQKGDFENARTMLADDFQFSGPVPEPINKETWLGMSVSLKTAFPDLDYHFKVIGTEGNVVKQDLCAYAPADHHHFEQGNSANSLSCCDIGYNYNLIEVAPIAQLDRALVFGTSGWEFESLWARY